MPVLPLPTIPYPAASGPQACADWCASTLAAVKSRAAVISAALPSVHVWLMQRQWLHDGGLLASYPLPLASGPPVALNVYGSPSEQDQVADVPSITYLTLPS